MVGCVVVPLQVAISITGQFLREFALFIILADHAIQLFCKRFALTVHEINECQYLTLPHPTVSKQSKFAPPYPNLAAQ